MNGKTMLMAALVGLALVSLSACGGSSSKKGGGVGSNLPTVPAIGWWLNGGTGVNGGNAGNLDIQGSGVIMADDGTPWPDITTNFLTAGVLANSIVDWAELEGLLTPTGANPNREFSLPAGTGLELPAGATLDLSGVPAGVNRVVFLSDSPIRIRGNILSTRTGDTAVTVAFGTSSTNSAAVVYSGWFDGRGDAGRNGGSLEVETDGGVVFLGSGNLSGGSDNTGLDGGHSGGVSVDALGDIRTRVFGIEANGGHGVATGMVVTSSGGNGGAITFQAMEFDMPVRWGLIAHGGNGEVDDGGNAGYLVVIFEQGEVDLWVRVIGDGGNGQMGDAGQAAGFSALGVQTIGWFLLDDTTVRGTAYVTGTGGSTEDGNAATGSTGYLEVWAETAEDLRLIADLPAGSSTNGSGGRGGAIGVYGRHMTNIDAALNAPGGNGGTFGGNGGRIDFEMSVIFGQAGTAGTATGIMAAGNLNGGQGALNPAGSGGRIALEVADLTASYTVSGVNFSGTLNGGENVGISGGGNGGTMLVAGSTGSYAATFSGTLNGGNGSAAGVGGNGGELSMTALGANLNLTVNNVIINGGTAESNTAGEGGALIVDADTGNTGNGSATVTVNGMIARGANSTGTGQGGGQGYAELRARGTGVLDVPVFNFEGRAGHSAQGMGGGNSNTRITLYTRGGGSVGSGTVNLSGGNGATQSGNGDGRAAAGLRIDVEGPLFTVNLNYTANGGNAGGTGSAGYGQAINVDLNSGGGATEGSVTMTGSYTQNGGNGATQAGGSPGWFDVSGAGAATTGGTFTFNGTHTATGGSLSGGSAGGGGWISIDILGDIVIGGNMTMIATSADNSADGSSISIVADGDITISGTVRTIAGGGGTTGGDGGTITIGNINTQNITVTASAVIQANGGAGSTPGAAGQITFTNSAGSYPGVSGSATIETLDGSGTDTNNVNFIV